VTAPRRFDAAKVAREARRFVDRLFLAGTLLWVVLGATTAHSDPIGWAGALILTAAWLFVWYVNRRGEPRDRCRDYAYLHESGETLRGVVVRSICVSALAFAVVVVRVGAESARKGRRTFWCRALCEQARGLEAGDEEEFLYAPRRPGRYASRFSLAALPVWEDEGEAQSVVGNKP
jgi:hypothetical protein